MLVIKRLLIQAIFAAISLVPTWAAIAIGFPGELYWIGDVTKVGIGVLGVFIQVTALGYLAIGSFAIWDGTWD